MREIHDGPIPEIPTLLFASNDEMVAQMTGTTENWLLIHENYLTSVTDGKLIKLDCGHYAHMEEPDRVSKEIITFVETLR